MKKAILAVILCCCILFSGCSIGTSIEDMLLAPSLTQDQIAVKEAIERHEKEPIVLKYPIDGMRRAPIQFFDLDGDSVSEAVVFYSIGDATALARMAVLKKSDDGWNVVESIEGKESNVETVNFNKLAGSNMFILVEWSAVTKQNKYLSLYRFEDNKIVMGIENAAYDYLVYDLDNDGIDEILYITLSVGRFTLQYADVSDMFADEVDTVRIMLDETMNACTALTAGTLADGTPAIFVDEMIGSKEDAETRYQMTEVFVLTGNRLTPVPIEDGDISLTSQRPLTGPVCSRLYAKSENQSVRNMVYIPSVGKRPIDINIAREDQWTFWYTVRDKALSYEITTYVDSNNEFALAVPDEWLATFSIRHTDANPHLWTVTNDEDYSILTLRILLPGESAANLGEAYELVGQTSTYKYYVRCSGTSEEMQFVKDNFIIL